MLAEIHVIFRNAEVTARLRFAQINDIYGTRGLNAFTIVKRYPTPARMVGLNLPPTVKTPVKESSVGLDSLESSLNAGSGKRLRAVWASSALAALLLFVGVNCFLWMRFGDDSQVKGSAKDSNRDLWSGAGSIDITVDGFKALKAKPTVVLLGSSLIMHPFWAMDAELGDVGDIFHHHESYRLARDLQQGGVDITSVYSLAVFGEMISDAYIYVNDFLKGDKTPKLVVFGIAPRDFSDADLPAPTASFTFKRLVGLKNIGRYASEYMPGWQEREEFVASHTCYLYGKRWRLSHETTKSVAKGFAKFGIASDTAEVAPAAGFMLGGTRDERFKISTKEYTRRYQGIGEKDLSLQLGFLNKILETCKNRGIKLVMVNMPLTEVNRALLPAGFYDRYRDQVSQLASNYSDNTKFVDLGTSPAFKDHDYWDTAHLNHLGGHKLLNAIEPVIFQSLRDK